MVWALEAVAPEPTDRLLEIGCGQGVAAAGICERLTSGTILAIDRSATAIAAARRRNRDHVRAGKAHFETVALADMAAGLERFDKIFAINVNLFWRDASRELEIVRRLLVPDGRLHLIYEPPTAAQLDRIARETVTALDAGGLPAVTVRRGTGDDRSLIHVAAAAKVVKINP